MGESFFCSLILARPTEITQLSGKIKYIHFCWQKTIELQCGAGIIRFLSLTGLEKKFDPQAGIFLFTKIISGIYNLIGRRVNSTRKKGKVSDLNYMTHGFFTAGRTLPAWQEFSGRFQFSNLLGLQRIIVPRCKKYRTMLFNNHHNNSIHRKRNKSLGVPELIAIVLGGMVGGGIFLSLSQQYGKLYQIL